MPQHTSIGFGFTVRQVVEMGCHPWRSAYDGPAEVVSESLDRVGMTGFAERTFRTLSGGEQALATFARVLAQCTPLLLLDEPTASLDLHHQERVMRIARDVADGGGAVVVVAHDLNLAAAYADRLCLLHRGAVAAEGTPWATLTEDVLEHVFGQPMIVTQTPGSDTPLLVPFAADRGYHATLMSARTFQFTSESVTEGHPDKIADQISDAVLDAVLADDADGRVACETLITTGLVVVAGEITTETYVDVRSIVRDTIREIGYTRAKYGFDAETCGVMVAIDEQSPDIAQGVDESFEAQHGDIDPIDGSAPATRG